MDVKIWWRVALLVCVMAAMIGLSLFVADKARTTRTTRTASGIVVGVDKPGTTQRESYGRIITRAENKVQFFEMAEDDWYLQGYQLGDCVRIEFSHDDVTGLHSRLMGKCDSPGGAE